MVNVKQKKNAYISPNVKVVLMTPEVRLLEGSIWSTGDDQEFVGETIGNGSARRSSKSKLLGENFLDDEEHAGFHLDVDFDLDSHY